MLADELDYVLGVDTHRDRHTLAVVARPTGAVVAQIAVQASARRYASALRFADTHAGGARLWAVEGAGHYGAGLTRFLAAHGERVLEVGRQRPYARVPHRLDRYGARAMRTHPAAARTEPRRLTHRERQLAVAVTLGRA